jgi:hypothetical protein
MKCPGQDSRFWKVDDVKTSPCPKCGAGVEFFKDDRSRKCPECGTRFKNPHLDLGCAEWCAYAKECIDYMAREEED